MDACIPLLRAAGFYVERTTRPRSRGIRYRIYRTPDETCAIVFWRYDLERAAAALLAGRPLPLPTINTPTGGVSAALRPKNGRYL